MVDFLVRALAGERPPISEARADIEDLAGSMGRSVFGPVVNLENLGIGTHYQPRILCLRKVPPTDDLSWEPAEIELMDRSFLGDDPLADVRRIMDRCMARVGGVCVSVYLTRVSTSVHSGFVAYLRHSLKDEAFCLLDGNAVVFLPDKRSEMEGALAAMMDGDGQSVEFWRDMKEIVADAVEEAVQSTLPALLNKAGANDDSSGICTEVVDSVVQSKAVLEALKEVSRIAGTGVLKEAQVLTELLHRLRDRTREILDEEATKFEKKLEASRQDADRRVNAKEKQISKQRADLEALIQRNQAVVKREQKVSAELAHLKRNVTTSATSKDPGRSLGDALDTLFD